LQPPALHVVELDAARTADAAGHNDQHGDDHDPEERFHRFILLLFFGGAGGGQMSLTSMPIWRMTLH
jgi:hypothetical protein